MHTLTLILLACLAGGLISIAAAAALVFRLSRRATGVLVAFAAGAMLSTAFLDVLPEAFASPGLTPESLFAVMLATLFVFFALERLALWRHSHGDCAQHDGHHATTTAPLLILIGDSFHNFVDGILIAAAFIADPLVGATTTIAIIAHEIPQEMGDFILLRNGGWSKTRAFIANGGSSLCSILGGVLGYFMLASAHEALPYVLVIAAASFIYVALADLLPLLHKQGDNFPRQAALIAAGVAVVPLVGWLVH